MEGIRSIFQGHTSFLTSDVPVLDPTLLAIPPEMLAVDGAQGESHHTFGINGFGRIGRTSFRVWWKFHRHATELKAINTSGSMNIGDWIHLLKYDSNYGAFECDMSFEQHQEHDKVSDEDPVIGTLTLHDPDDVSKVYTVTFTAQRDPAKIPWSKLGVETVIESTGVFISKEKASLHLQAGARYVIISAPPKGPGIPTTVLGVKEAAASDTVLSNASCTTNSVAPVVQVINSVFGIAKATLTTIHSYTDDQNLHDNSHRDLRRGRDAALNIVPTTTGAAIATTEVIPELKGLFDGLAIRVPTPVGSLSDMVFVLKKKTSIEEVNAALETASNDPIWKGILAVTHEPLVSRDIVGRRESSIVDLALTQVIDGDLVKVIAWYDNEWGYCNRLVEQVVER